MPDADAPVFPLRPAVVRARHRGYRLVIAACVSVGVAIGSAGIVALQLAWGDNTIATASTATPPAVVAERPFVCGSPGTPSE